MKTLVERIRNRELAIENDGSVEEFRKVLKHCFPEDKVLCGGNFKFYCAYKHDTNKWDCYNDTDLPTVSVKEVLAEIENKDMEALDYSDIKSESKQTKVIYLNEEDRPKIEEPLSFMDWLEYSDNLTPKSTGRLNLGRDKLNEVTKEWLEYLNNFKPNDKPIEFECMFDTINTGWLQDNCFTPSQMDLIIVISNTEFIGIQEDTFHGQWRFKGNLNNGKVN